MLTIFSLSLISFLLYTIDGNNIFFSYAELTTTNSSDEVENYDINVSDIPAKKISIGDIDIAYKIFGKGILPLVLISGSANVMDAWPHLF